MTEAQRNQIQALRTSGYGYAAIANSLELKKDTVVAFCRKMGLTGVMAVDNNQPIQVADTCAACGKPLLQIAGRKKARFCSAGCRVSWWNSHPEAVNRKAVYNFVCVGCGKPFTAYGNAGRKYCSHSCYIADRFKGGDCHE